MKKKICSPKPLNLPESVHRQLHMYILAASAAGVSVLALAQPGEAEIIYKRAHVHIATNSTFALDLNRDGAIDFNFRDTWTSSVGTAFWGFLWVNPGQTGNSVVSAGYKTFASALPSGAPIGSTGRFAPGNLLMGREDFIFVSHRRRLCYGPWSNVKNRYLGLKFLIDGEVHYGWARFTERCNTQGVTAVLTGYAYETVPNQGLLAGQTKGLLEDKSDDQIDPAAFIKPTPRPATLANPAQGALTLTTWRQK